MIRSFQQGITGGGRSSDGNTEDIVYPFDVKAGEPIYYKPTPSANVGEHKFVFNPDDSTYILSTVHHNGSFSYAGYNATAGYAGKIMPVFNGITFEIQQPGLGFVNTNMSNTNWIVKTDGDYAFSSSGRFAMACASPGTGSSVNGFYLLVSEPRFSTTTNNYLTINNRYWYNRNLYTTSGSLPASMDVFWSKDEQIGVCPYYRCWVCLGDNILNDLGPKNNSSQILHWGEDNLKIGQFTESNMSRYGHMASETKTLIIPKSIADTSPYWYDWDADNKAYILNQNPPLSFINPVGNIYINHDASLIVTSPAIGSSTSTMYVIYYKEDDGTYSNSTISGLNILSVALMRITFSTKDRKYIFFYSSTSVANLLTRGENGTYTRQTASSITFANLLAPNSAATVKCICESTNPVYKDVKNVVHIGDGVHAVIVEDPSSTYGVLLKVISPFSAEITNMTHQVANVSIHPNGTYALYNYVPYSSTGTWYTYNYLYKYNEDYEDFCDRLRSLSGSSFYLYNGCGGSIWSSSGKHLMCYRAASSNGPAAVVEFYGLDEETGNTVKYVAPTSPNGTSVFGALAMDDDKIVLMQLSINSYYKYNESLGYYVKGITMPATGSANNIFCKHPAIDGFYVGFKNSNTIRFFKYGGDSVGYELIQTYTDTTLYNLHSFYPYTTTIPQFTALLCYKGYLIAGSSAGQGCFIYKLAEDGTIVGYNSNINIWGDNNQDTFLPSDISQITISALNTYGEDIILSKENLLSWSGAGASSGGNIPLYSAKERTLGGLVRDGEQPIDYTSIMSIMPKASNVSHAPWGTLSDEKHGYLYLYGAYLRRYKYNDNRYSFSKIPPIPMKSNRYSVYIPLLDAKAGIPIKSTVIKTYNSNKIIND